jgi:DNA-binding MarR family transcriptional regulator
MAVIQALQSNKKGSATRANKLISRIKIAGANNGDVIKDLEEKARSFRKRNPKKDWW